MLMMKQNKNSVLSHKKLRTAGWLMTISIALLVLFQAYWLHKTYKDERSRLKRELSFIFRDAMFKERMRKIEQQREAGGADSLKREDGIHSITIRQSVDEKLQPQTFRKRLPDSSSSSTRVMRMEAQRRNQANAPDTVLSIRFPFPADNADSVAAVQLLEKELAEANIPLKMVLQKPKPDTTAQRGLSSGMGRGYQNIGLQSMEARFSNPFLFLMGKMVWQLLFAVVMLTVTMLAFIFLYRNLRQQQRLADLKNAFIGNITHELKTPVATVSIAIEALKNFNAINDTQRTKEYLDISSNELQRLGLLIDKVLKLSMFEQNRITLNKETVDLKALTEEVLTTLKPQFDKQDAEVQVVYQGKDFKLQGDMLHLQSVLYNLLDNALKYSSGRPDISVQLTADNNDYWLSIADKGIGIPALYQEKVFETFFRVPQGNEHNIKGYGLGLSYVAEVVRRHGGQIQVKPNGQQGSVFIVKLPKA